MLAKVHHLNQPTKLEAALKEDQASVDCLPCRIIGSSAFIGLGTYTFFSGHAQLRQQEAIIRKSGSRFGMRIRRGGITGIAAVLLGMGLYRLVN